MGAGVKILFFIFKRNLVNQIEVGEVGEKDLVDAKPASVCLSSQNKSLQHKILLCSWQNNRQ